MFLCYENHVNGVKMQTNKSNIQIFWFTTCGKAFFFFFFCSFRKSCLSDINCLQLLPVKKLRGCQGFPSLQQIDSLTGMALQNSLVRYVASLMMFPSCPHVPHSPEDMWELNCPKEQPRKPETDGSPLHSLVQYNNLMFFISTFFSGHLMDYMRHFSYLWPLRDVTIVPLQDRKLKCTRIEGNWMKSCLCPQYVWFRKGQKAVFNCRCITVEAVSQQNRCLKGLIRVFSKFERTTQLVCVFEGNIFNDSVPVKKSLCMFNRNNH